MGYEQFTVEDLWRLMNKQAPFAPFLTANPWVRVEPTPDGVLITPRTTHPNHTICLYPYGDVDGVMWVTTSQGQSWRVAIDDDMQVGGCDFKLADCRQLWVGITPENVDGEPDWQGYDTTGQAVHDVAAWLIQDRCRTHNQG